MSISMIIGNTITVSVILMMFGVGLRTSLSRIVVALQHYETVLRGVVANFIVSPLIIYLVLLALPLPAGIKIGIMLMAAAPVAPMAPQFVDGARGDVAYGVGLMVVVAIMSIVLTPLILGLSLPAAGEGVALRPMQIVKTLLIVQLLPISAGLLVRSQRPEWADRLVKFIPKIGQTGLAIGVCLMLMSQFDHILSISLLAVAVLLLLVIGCLLLGHWMMAGKTQELRRSLAVSTAIRNVPLALLIANASYPDSIVGPVTLVFSVFTMVLSVLYGKLIGRGHT